MVGSQTCVVPEDFTTPQTMTAVSAPSRATETMPIQMRPWTLPDSRAWSASAWMFAVSWREFLPIQKIIQVTKSAATMEKTPPRISCAWKVMVMGPQVQ